MTEQEILQGEANDIEYKEQVPANSRSYTRTVAAFANGAGGRIIFGVHNDDWQVVGIPHEQLFTDEDRITNAIYDSVEPTPDFDVSYQSIEGKDIIVVRVYPGRRRPYYLKPEGKDSGTYLRVAGTTRHAGEDLVRDLEFQGARRSFDDVPVIAEEVTEAEIGKLCEDMYQYALVHARNEVERGQIKPVEKKHLLAWHLLAERGGKILPTNGFRLLTDNPYFQSAVQCAVFKGTTRAVFVDKQEYAGPIYKQVDEAYNFVLRNIRVGMEIVGVTGQPVYELPIGSIREIVANAVVHRAYHIGEKIQVFLYDDRLEITSPGMLVGGASLSDVRMGRSKFRNQGLAKAFAYLRIIENFGSGIPRLYEECRAQGLSEPKMQELYGAFRVEIYRKKADLMSATECPGTQNGTPGTKTGTPGTKIGTTGTQELNEQGKDESLRRLRALLRQNPQMKRKELANELGVGLRTVARYLSEMPDVRYVGRGSLGHWEVIDKDRSED